MSEEQRTGDKRDGSKWLAAALEASKKKVPNELSEFHKGVADAIRETISPTQSDSTRHMLQGGDPTYGGQVCACSNDHQGETRRIQNEQGGESRHQTELKASYDWIVKCNETLARGLKMAEAELAKHQESEFHPDWSLLEATRAVVKEQAAEILKLNEKLDKHR